MTRHVIVGELLGGPHDGEFVPLDEAGELIVKGIPPFSVCSVYKRGLVKEDTTTRTLVVYRYSEEMTKQAKDRLSGGRDASAHE